MKHNQAASMYIVATKRLFFV